MTSVMNNAESGVERHFPGTLNKEWTCVYVCGVGRCWEAGQGESAWYVWLSVCEKHQIDRWQDVHNMGGMAAKTHQPLFCKESPPVYEQKICQTEKFFICSQFKENDLIDWDYIY